MGGLRLLIQHATSNSALCEVVIGSGAQPVRYSCNDMVAIDREIEETRALERYIDAHAGGPGQGWFRIVDSPAAAREVIEEGKLAVVLGIEVSNLFDCFLTPPDGFTRCTEADVVEKLDHYYDLGVRVLFPVHKYDNAFSAGDGNRGLPELGNWVNSGHWSNFVEDCPTELPNVFDKGGLTFGGLNMPRAEYDSPAPLDFSGLSDNPIEALSPHLDALMEPPLEGDFCMNHGLTPLGETLMVEMMKRGMVIEIDHFSRRSYESAVELLEMYDYPGAGTHGTNANGRLYAVGGISKNGIGRCADPANPSAMVDGLLADVALIEANGGYPAEGFGFDFNGFAGAPGPRFGDRANCSLPQDNPVTYPFTSYGGDVTFTEPRAGNRVFDFNTEGMAHIGLMPELIEDARRTGVTDEELEPLFRSAEGYLRMWERAEERAAELR
jgi:microsomal dipeptidase-like Zn-dependent dipeptidase